MEGNTSVYQVNSASQTTGDGRAKFLRTWGTGFDQDEAGWDGGVGTDGAAQFVRGKYKSFRG